MSKNEIKEFLLNQEKTKELMNGHFKTKRTSNTLLALGGISLGVGFITATQAGSLSDLELPAVLIAAGLLSSSFGIFTGIASTMYFHKAKKQFLEIKNIETKTLQIQIRNDQDVMSGIF